MATLTPVHDVRRSAESTPLTCLICGEQGGTDVASNLLLFLPLAIGLRLSGASWRGTVVACGLLSFTVELLQLRVVPGRDASLSDLITNTIGAAIGAAIGNALPAAVRPRPSLAGRLLVAGIAALLALLTASAWMLSPGTPEGALRSQWAHAAPSPDAFDGQVSAVRLDGLPMPGNAAPPDSAGLRRRLGRGELVLDVGIVSGRPISDRLWIYKVRGPSGAVLTLNQFRREAGVELPTRGLRYRFRPAIATLPDAFPAEPGVPVRLRVVEEGRRVRLTSSYGGTERSVELGLSPAYGWSMLVPVELASGTAVRWVTALGLLGVFLPLGYWARRTGRPVAVLGAPAAALAAGLGVLPAVAGSPPVHWSEWAAGLLGIAAGWALRPPAAYLQRRCASPSDSEFSSS